MARFAFCWHCKSNKNDLINISRGICLRSIISYYLEKLQMDIRKSSALYFKMGRFKIVGAKQRFRKRQYRYDVFTLYKYYLFASWQYRKYVVTAKNGIS